MNGVDQSNQLRKNFTAHQLYERRVWRPLWYYILDICAVNSYLIWKEGTTNISEKGVVTDTSKRGQRPFRKALIDALLKTPYSEPTRSRREYKFPLPNRDTQDHRWQAFPKRGLCIWCRKGAQESKSKNIDTRRPILAEIVNSNASSRSMRSYGGCIACNVHLCVKGACFKQYHSQ